MIFVRARNCREVKLEPFVSGMYEVNGVDTWNYNFRFIASRRREI